MSGIAGLELTNRGWRETSQFEKFEPEEYLTEFLGPSEVDSSPKGRELDPQVWQKTPVDYSSQVEILVSRKFRQAVGHEVNHPERFDVNGRVADYMNDERRGNGQVIAQISKQLYQNSAEARRGSALQELYRSFKERDIQSISLVDFTTALTKDYNRHKNASEGIF